MSAQLKVRLTLSLTLPEETTVEDYKRALGVALDAFKAEGIAPRVAAVTFAATDTMPAVHTEFREPAEPASR